MRDAEGRKRVAHGAADDRRSRHTCGFAQTFDTERIGGRRCDFETHTHARNLIGLGKDIVEQRAAYELAGCLVLGAFVQSLADPLGHPAMDLAFGKLGVDEVSDIIDADIVKNLNLTGIDINLDDSGVGTVPGC